MDDDIIPLPAAPRPGGTVEPLNRAAVAKDRFQTPADSQDRYELRDPFAEVTYRATTFAEMVAKAEQMGSSRFTAIDADGRRTPVIKVNGEWSKDVPRQQTRDAAIPPVESTRDAGRSTSSTQESSEHGSTTALDARVERAARVSRLEAALQERYVIKRTWLSASPSRIGQTEYRFRGDTSRVAFTETTFRLATDTNSPSVARSMVDLAEARNWKALRVSGNEDFRRMVWLEASIRGVKAVGYEPQMGDLDLVQQQREARLVNRVEPGPVDRSADTTVSPVAPSTKGANGRGGGRKAVLAAIEAILVDKRVPAARREAILIAATEQLAQRVRAGQTLSVKVYDKEAPSHRSVPIVRPQTTRDRDRPAPQR